MRAIAPIAITGADLDVALVPDGIAAAISPGSVRVANESNFALQCSIGPDLHWLQPWSVDVWEVHGSTVLHVHPIQLTTPLPSSTWSTLLVTVAAPYESIPGTYPASLNRQASQYGLAVVLKHISVAANGGDFEGLDVPAGTQAVGWQMDAIAGDGEGPDQVTITGQQSGDQLGLWQFPFSDQKMFAVPIGPVDTRVSVSIAARAAAACGVYVIAWSAAPAAPLPVTVAAATGAELLAVSEQLANPAPWQAANQAPLSFVQNLAVPGVTNVIPAAAGVTLYLHFIGYTPNGAGAFGGRFEDTAGTPLLSDTVQVGATRPFVMRGAVLPTGRGLQWNTQFAGAVFLNGTIVYSKG